MTDVKHTLKNYLQQSWGYAPEQLKGVTEKNLVSLIKQIVGEDGWNILLNGGFWEVSEQLQKVDGVVDRVVFEQPVHV